MVTQEERISVGKKAGITGILCNLALCVSKFIIGSLSGSVSITADAVNNLSDAASSIVTLLGFKLAGKKADAEHPYGYDRFEYLAGLIVAALILIIGVELVKSSIDKIIHPADVEFSVALVIVLSLSIALKLWLASYNVRLGRSINSQTLIASGSDARNDVISTGAVLLASIVEKLTGLRVDGYIGLLVALFIIWSGIGIARDTISPLLGEAPDEELVHNISGLITSKPGVLGVHDLIVHDYGPGRRYASAHAEMDYRSDVLTAHELLDDIEHEAMEKYNVELTIHYDPIVTDDPVLNQAKQLVTERLHEIDSNIKLHDFRFVRGEGHSNVLFDMVIPQGSALDDPQAQAGILRTVNELLNSGRIAGAHGRFFAVITFDSEAFNDPHCS